MDYSYPIPPRRKKRKRTWKTIIGLIPFTIFVIGLFALSFFHFPSGGALSTQLFTQVNKYVSFQKDDQAGSDKDVLAAANPPADTPVPTTPPTATPIPPTRTPTPTPTATPTPTPIPTWNLTGRVYVDTNLSKLIDAAEIGYAGTTVTVSGPSPASTTTDASGNYTFTGLKQGTYTVTVAVPIGYKSTTTNPATIGLSSNQTLQFGFAQTYTVTGRIFLDNNRNTAYDTGDGDYNGGTVTFNGPVTTTAKTNADGVYTAQLFAGIYKISTSLPTSSYTPSTPTSVNSTVNANQTVNFGWIPIFSISGQIYEDSNQDGKKGNEGKGNSGDSSVGGITVTLSGAASATTTTDSGGNFDFNNLYAGTYTVSYTLPNKKKSTTTTSQTVTFVAPVSRSASPTSAPGSTPSPTSAPTPSEKTNIDFGLVTVFEIRGRSFIDGNTNGILDAGEQPYANARVTLDGNSPGTVNTNASGLYSFPERIKGEYTINIDTPTGYRSTTPNALNFPLSDDKVINFGFVLSSTPTVGNACSPYGIDVVMIFDVSGSMDDVNENSGNPKIEDARSAALAFIDGMRDEIPNGRIGIVKMAGGLNYPHPDGTDLLVGLTTNYGQLRSAVNDIETVQVSEYNQTCFDCGIHAANEHLLANARPDVLRMIIFMTDGLANAVRGVPDQVDVSIAENETMTQVIDGVNDQNILYNTIGMGGGADINETFLRQIADTNGGRYYNSPLNGSVQEIYESIINRSTGTGIINGKIFHDQNTNKVQDPGEPNLSGWTVHAKTPEMGTGTPLSFTTDANGSFSMTGLCSRNYTITQNLKPGWYQTTDNAAYTLSVVTGNTYNNIIFGNTTGYSISGNIFEDFNKDTRYASPDALHLHDTTILFSGPTSKTVTTSSGVYSSGAMPPGTYTVSLFSPLTTGYSMTYPLNGPPPSFQVTIGPGCKTSGPQGGECE